MSMPVNNIRATVLAGLPLILLVVAVCVVVWLNTKSTPFSTGTRLHVHQALMNIPEEDTTAQLKKFLPQIISTGRDPFFRPATPQPLDPVKTDHTPITAILQEIHLTTIAQGKIGNYCLVNGKIYHEGQQGEGFTVGKINEREVVFSTPLQTFNLKPGKKVTLESGKLIHRDDKKTEAGIKLQTQASDELPGATASSAIQ
jgi:hypothetical protein